MDSSLPLDSIQPDSTGPVPDSPSIAAVENDSATAGALVRRIVLFNGLFIAWFLAWSNWSAFIHEMGHLLAALVKGGKAYGFIIWANRLGAGGMSLLDAGEETRSSYLLAVGGVGLSILTGLLLMLLLGRLRRFKALRFGLGLLAVMLIMRSFFYLLEGFYGEMGDFSMWKRTATLPGLLAIGFLYALILPLAFGMGRWFLPIAETYLPSRSRQHRLAQMLSGIGPLYAYLAGCYVYTWGVDAAIPGIYIVAAIGFLLASLTAPLAEKPEQLPFRVHAFAMPIVLLGLAHGWIGASGSFVALPSPSKLPDSAEYTDTKVMSLPGQSLMPNTRDYGNLDALFLRTARIDSDGNGRIFGLNTSDRSVWVMDTQTNMVETIYQATGRLDLLRVKYAGDHLFLLGARRRTMFIGKINLRTQLYTPVYEGILGTNSGLAATTEGAVYFVDGKHPLLGGNTLCRLDAQTGQIAELQGRLPTVYALALAGDGTMYALAGQNGMLLKLGKDANTAEVLCSGLKFTNDLAVDDQGSLFVSGRGNDTIMKLTPPEYQPVRVRGPYYVSSLAVRNSGEVYYYCWEQMQVRVLGKK